MEGFELELCGHFKHYCANTIGPDDTLNGCVDNLFDLKDQCLEEITIDQTLEDCMMEKLGIKDENNACQHLEGEDKVYCAHFAAYCEENTGPGQSLHQCIDYMTASKDECLEDMGLHETLEDCIAHKAPPINDDDKVDDDFDDDGLGADDGLEDTGGSTHDTGGSTQDTEGSFEHSGSTDHTKMVKLAAFMKEKSSEGDKKSVKKAMMAFETLKDKEEKKEKKEKKEKE